MKNTKQALLGRLPKRYHDRVNDFTEEDGLIDHCKYILHYSHDYTDGECEGGTLPCRSIKEACEFVRNLERVNNPRTKIKDSTMVVVYTGLCNFMSECEVKEVTEGRK